jgi:hypothetical protein
MIVVCVVLVEILVDAKVHRMVSILLITWGNTLMLICIKVVSEGK